ncbi:MAG: MerR family transcriptional regulator [Chloroflexota bacterium]
MTEKMTIQACAAQVALPPSTLRYYERKGLMPPVARDENGHRLYSEDDVHWINFVKCMRQTGMPLKEIRAFGVLHFGRGSVRERVDILTHHHARMAAQQDELAKAMDFIGNKIARFEAFLARTEGLGEA